MKLSEILNIKLNESKQEDEAFVKSFLADHGIHSKSAIDDVWHLAKQHHAEANRISDLTKNNTVMAGEKILTSKEFFKVVTDLRIALAKRQHSAPTEASTRHIMSVTDMEQLDDIKEFVKAHNKANKEDKIKLGIYDRPANKEINVAHKSFGLMDQQHLRGLKSHSLKLLIEPNLGYNYLSKTNVGIYHEALRSYHS